MKTIIKFSILILTMSLLTSCRRHSETMASNIEQKAREYLQPLLHIGDTTNSLIARFGAPFYKYETGEHELAMYFYFPDQDHAALAAGVGGFTGFFTNNQLSYWDPIY